MKSLRKLDKLRQNEELLAQQYYDEEIKKLQVEFKNNDWAKTNIYKIYR